MLIAETARTNTQTRQKKTRLRNRDKRDGYQKGGVEDK